MFTDWVTNAGGNLIAMRPDKQLAGLLGLTDTGTTLADGYLQVDTSAAPGAGHRRRDHAIPRHGGSLHAERRDRVCYAVLDRDNGDDQSGGHDPQRWRIGWTGGRVHLRPGPLGRLHAARQSGVGGSGT